VGPHISHSAILSWGVQRGITPSGGGLGVSPSFICSPSPCPMERGIQGVRVFRTAVTFAMIVEYDGTRYCGFQRQRSQPTIQAELERAIGRFTGEEAKIKAASRTDTGVHARGQVVAFQTRAPYPAQVFLKALNHFLPKDIAIKSVYGVPEGFNVRREAMSREYHYTILNSRVPSPLSRGFSHQVDQSLDLGRMKEAAKLLLGRHDYRSFAGSLKGRKSGVRTMYRCDIDNTDSFTIFTFEADAFLPQQIRMMVGSLLKVGFGKMSPQEFKALLDSGKPGAGGPAVPPAGLCLTAIKYKDFPPKD